MDQRRRPNLTLLFGTALLASGCVAPGWQGRSPIRASSFGQGLSSALPAETPVPAVVAAATDVLSERGLVVIESTATLDHGRVIAQPNFSGHARETVVRVKRTLNTTEVRVASGLGEGGGVERDILEKILTRIGL